MKLCQLSNQDTLHRYKKALVLTFAGPRNTLSTGPDNGGFREDLKAVFNVDINPGAGMGCVMRGKTYEEHMNIIAKEDLGLDPATCTGLCTAASMENVSIKTKVYDDFTVTAIVTGGIEHNGGRVGDTALWHEREGMFCPEPPGTINILLHIDADLDPGAIARSLVTCTEAKTAAIQELLAPSCSSHGIATGSGTDGTIIITNPQSKTRLTNAGKNSKLGEYIGVAVMAAVKEALSLQSGLNPAYQHDVLRRLGRFGVTEDVLWDRYQEMYRKAQAAEWTEEEPCRTEEEPGRAERNPVRPEEELSRAEFTHRLDSLRRESRLVTGASLYAHLLDQLEWGLLTPEEVYPAAREILAQTGGESAPAQEREDGEEGIPAQLHQNEEGGASAQRQEDEKPAERKIRKNPADVVATLTESYISTLIKIIAKQEEPFA